jgi:hypothetical protein
MTNIFGFAPIDLSQASGPNLVHVGFGKVNAISMYNHGTVLAALMLYDLGRVPLLQTDVPNWQFGCPFAATAGQGTCQFDATFIAGLKFVNGLAYALTTTLFKSGNMTLFTQGSPPTLVGAVDWEVRP